MGITDATCQLLLALAANLALAQIVWYCESSRLASPYSKNGHFWLQKDKEKQDGDGQNANSRPQNSRHKPVNDYRTVCALFTQIMAVIYVAVRTLSG